MKVSAQKRSFVINFHHVRDDGFTLGVWKSKVESCLRRLMRPGHIQRRFCASCTHLYSQTEHRALPRQSDQTSSSPFLSTLHSLTSTDLLITNSLPPCVFSWTLKAARWRRRVACDIISHRSRFIVRAVRTAASEWLTYKNIHSANTFHLELPGRWTDPVLQLRAFSAINDENTSRIRTKLDHFSHLDQN